MLKGRHAFMLSNKTLWSKMTAHKYIKNSGAVIRSAPKVTFWKDKIHGQSHWFKNRTAFAHATCNQRWLELYATLQVHVQLQPISLFSWPFSLAYKSVIIKIVLQHHSVYNSPRKAVSCSQHTSYTCMCTCVLKKHVKNVLTCDKKKLSVDDCLWCFNELKNVVWFGFSSSFKVNA